MAEAPGETTAGLAHQPLELCSFAALRQSAVEVTDAEFLAEIAGLGQPV